MAMEREPMQDLVTHRDVPDGFAFTASACHGAVRLRASGRRTLAADHHEHLLFIRLVLNHHGRRVLRGNKSGSAAEFQSMDYTRRAKAVAGIVSRARFPPGCAEAVERCCARAAACGREKLCDDVTVTVVWRPRGAGEVVMPAVDAGGDRPSPVSSWLSKPFLFWLLGCLDES